MKKAKFPQKARAPMTAVMCMSLGFAILLSGAGVREAGATGTSSGVTKKTYYPDFDNFEEEQKSAAELNKQIAEEGMILLKNKDNALPLSNLEKNITVFGKGSTNLLYGGSGSGSGSGDYVTLQESLAEAGFNVNPLVTSLYKNVEQENLASAYYGKSYGSAFVRESDPDDVLATASSSYKLYNDAAVIVLTRSGGEGSDLPKLLVAGHTDTTEHYLELDDNEKKLIEIAKKNFDKIIIAVNSSNPIELGGLKNDDDIDAILWLGAPGTNGILAVGEILNGSVNPSGKTVDIFPTDFTKDPTWYNTGDNAQTHYTGIVSGYATYDTQAGGKYVEDYTTVRLSDGSAPTFNSHEYYSVTYKEGIYLGYRYYETVADLMDTSAAGTGESWYQTAVAYPFGYGLSYTTFSMEMLNFATDDAKQKVTFDVKVTNTGSVAGKQVVQIYSNPPYEEDEIEKATANFIDFAKTDMLQPNESQTVSFSISYEDFASFDAADYNGNKHSGYELDAGDYVISVNYDSHTVADSETWTVGADINFDDAGVLFTNHDEFSTTREASLNLEGTTVQLTGSDMDQLTRKSGTALSLTTSGAATDVSVLKTTVQKDLTFSKEFVDYLNDEEDIYAYEDDATDAWYKTSADIEGWSQAGQRPDGLDKAQIQLWKMNGEEYGNDKWVKFMNQLTYYEMVELLSEGHYYNIANERIGKPYAHDVDGPAQLKGNLANGFFWCAAATISATYNKDLAYKQGLHVGNESILTDTNGWYGPSMNIHRSPFSGRNFEYYSQDGKQGGLMAAAVVKGAVEKGTHVYLKHFALNDQETHRHGIMTWVNEQAAREIYFKNFELPVTMSDANGTMCAFNRIGLKPATNFAVYEQLLVDEWGFKGVSVTDGNGSGSTAYGWNGNNDARASVFPLSYGYKGITTPEVATGNNMEGYYDKATNMLYIPNETQAKAGTNAVDGNGNRVWTTQGITQWYWVRTSCMNMLYVIANGNAMDNGVDISGFVDKTVNLTQSVNASVDLSAGLQGTVFNFEVTDGALPDGVTLSALGELSGRPTASGTYTAKVSVTVDNYIQQTATYTFVVDSMFAAKVKDVETTGDISLVKGTSYQNAINISVSEETLTAMGFDFDGSTSSKGADTIAYSVTSANLPEGMDTEVTANGIEIFGTPAKSGTYDVTVRIAWTDQDGFRGFRSLTSYFSETYTIVVPEVAHTVTVNYNCADISNASVTVSDGTTVSLSMPTRSGYIFTGWYADEGCTVAFDANGKISSDITVYAGWMQITESKDNSAEIEDLTKRVTELEKDKKTNGGCSGSIQAGTIVIMAAALGAIVMTFVCGRKKENDDKE